MKLHLCPPDLKLTTILFGLIIPLCGCSSTYPVRYTTNAQLNEELAERRVTIELQRGEEIPAKEVKIFNDSASWLDERTKEEHKVGMEKIKKIVIIREDPVLGPLEWLCLGALGGAGIGWLHAAGRPEGNRREFIYTDIIGDGLLGSAIGLAFGAIVGHHEYYEYQLTEGSDFGRETRIKEPTTKTDVLYLKNGDIVRGTIVYEDLMYVTIRSADGKTGTYYYGEIERIKKGN